MLKASPYMSDDDDDFQYPSHSLSLSQKNRILPSLQKTTINPISQPLKPSNGTRSSNKTKPSTSVGKENSRFASSANEKRDSGVVKRSGLNAADFSRNCGNSGVDSSSRAESGISLNGVSIDLDEVKSSLLNLNESKPLELSRICCSNSIVDNGCFGDSDFGYSGSLDCTNKEASKSDKVYAFNSAESRLLEPVTSCRAEDEVVGWDDISIGCDKKGFFGLENGYLSNSVESRLLTSRVEINSLVDNSCFGDGAFGCSGSLDCSNKEASKSNKVSAFNSVESRLLEPVTSCRAEDEVVGWDDISIGCDKKGVFGLENGYLSNSVESRLLTSRVEINSLVDNSCFGENDVEDFEPGTQLNVLMKLCSEIDEGKKSNGTDFLEGEGLGDSVVECPLCGIDISGLNEEQRLAHTNGCLDREEEQHVQSNNRVHNDEIQKAKVVDVSPVLEWLHCLGLSRYDEAFVREEVDWDTLHWLTEEDLFNIGVTALGPRKKIVHALTELRKGSMHTEHTNTEMDDASRVKVDRNCKLAGNKLITEYFLGSSVDKKRDCAPSIAHRGLEETKPGSGRKRTVGRSHVRNEKLKDTPSWCCITGTPFRVDAFRYLRSNCSHWFLTHFHIDHYQGLTRSFCHGKIYCSSITARLVNMKIGIPWDRLQVLPLNQKITIANVDVTCFDANHCPGSIIILFEPPNGKAVLHTGDFRFNEDMKSVGVLQSCPIHTLILDTTYSNPQYDFPKQEAVIQFVVEAIQAEAFNPKTLFLIGSYTIGKERLFLEVARVLQKKVYVGAAKLRLLDCLGLPEEDMRWFTKNERESHIHVVPMWTIASFKRMKHLSSQYSGRYNLIVAFSPTGWTFGKGKKKTPGRRWQQGTIIRYEVPYSEHCSFTELREFVQFVSPEKIIPSVNNDGAESADAMISLLVS